MRRSSGSDWILLCMRAKASGCTIGPGGGEVLLFCTVQQRLEAGLLRISMDDEFSGGLCSPLRSPVHKPHAFEVGVAFVE